MWSTPRHGVDTDFTSAKVCASRKSSRCIALGDDDRVAAVGREVHVVRIVDRNRPCRLPRLRIDLGQRVAGVVRDVEVLQVVRGDDVLRQSSDREVVDDLVRRADRSRRPCSTASSGRRSSGERRSRRTGQVAGTVGRVDVVGVDRASAPPPSSGGSGASSEIVATVPEPPRPPASRIRPGQADGREIRAGGGEHARARRSFARSGRPPRSQPSACRASRSGRRSRTRGCRAPPRQHASSGWAGARCASPGRSPGRTTSTASLAVPAGVEPPAITIRPATAATAA